jgi:hypothetical protein
MMPKSSASNSTKKRKLLEGGIRVVEEPNGAYRNRQLRQ